MDFYASVGVRFLRVLIFDDEIDVVLDLQEILLAVLEAVPTGVLDDVRHAELKVVPLNEFNGLNLHAAVVVATNLSVECRHHGPDRIVIHVRWSCLGAEIHGRGSPVKFRCRSFRCL